MKTFNVILIIGMFLGQLTFGKGNDTCCPDTSSVELVAAAKEAELEQLQTESHSIALSLPSLYPQVDKKLTKDSQALSLLQLESEMFLSGYSEFFSSQVRVKLNERIEQDVRIAETEPIKF